MAFGFEVWQCSIDQACRHECMMQAGAGFVHPGELGASAPRRCFCRKLPRKQMSDLRTAVWRVPADGANVCGIFSRKRVLFECPLQRGLYAFAELLHSTWQSHVVRIERLRKQQLFEPTMFSVRYERRINLHVTEYYSQLSSDLQ